MNMFFIMLFIFVFGCIFGWCLELIFRRIISKPKKWINPGFLVGPYLPLYGFGLMNLYIMANLEPYITVQNIFLRKIVLFVLMGIAMTVLEYIAGIVFIKKMKIKLWDYSDMLGNIQGIICPLYSFFWTLLGIVYYFVLHPYVTDIVNRTSESAVTFFLLGMFYGVFIIDFVYSMQVVAKIKQFAEEQQIVIKLEELKANIIKNAEEHKNKAKFFFILSHENAVVKNLKYYHSEMKRVRGEIINKIKEDIVKK